MAKAKTGDKVKVEYLGSLKDGKVFDSSDGKEPLEFIIGEKAVILGFESAIIGMAEGEIKKVSIPQEEAYGDYKKENVATVQKSELPPDLIPQVGLELQAQADKGQTSIVRITEVTDKTVTLDANHPLAGQDLVFELKLVSIGKEDSGTDN